MSQENNDAYRQFLDTPLPVGPAPLVFTNPRQPDEPQTGSPLYANLQITLDVVNVAFYPHIYFVPSRDVSDYLAETCPPPMVIDGLGGTSTLGLAPGCFR